MKRYLILGPSGSGKTTLARELADRLDLVLISMDDFRVKMVRNAPTVEVGGRKIRSYENPVAWDANAIWFKAQACIKSGMGFVIEGNHLLQYPRIAEIPDTERVYLDCDFATSIARRKQRNRGTAADESFAIIGEGETARWVVPQKAMPGVRVLDATRPTAELLAEIVSPVREGVGA